MTSVTRPGTRKLAGRKHLKPTKTLLFAAFLLAVLAMSNIAKADILTGDPRVCTFGPARKADCARLAAQYTFIRYMRTHGHRSFSNPTTCSSQGTLFRWRCDFGTGTSTVIFKALASGWHRSVYVTMR